MILFMTTFGIRGVNQMKNKLGSCKVCGKPVFNGNLNLEQEYHRCDDCELDYCEMLFRPYNESYKKECFDMARRLKAKV